MIKLGVTVLTMVKIVFLKQARMMSVDLPQ
jgi:hypothetical protein